MKTIINTKYFVGVGIFLLIFTSSANIFAQVRVDGAFSSEISANPSNSITFSHTTGQGTDRLLLVGVSWNSGNQSRDIQSVTFTPSGGGSAITLSEVYTQRHNTPNQYKYSAIYKYEKPTSGTTGNVTVTFSHNIKSGIVAGAVNFSGVDQTTPLGIPAGSSGNSMAPSITLTGLNGDELVFDNLMVATDVNTETLTAGTSQSTFWNVHTLSTRAAASSKQASGSSVIMDWTINSSSNRYWVITAVPIKPAINTWLGTTSTDWHTASNWTKGIPTSVSDVVIPQNPVNQPIISTPIEEPSQEAFAQSVIINSGASLTLEPTGKATFTSFTNNGTLNLNSTSTGTASLMVGSYSGNDANIELFLSSDYWHYISSPIGGLSVNEFSAGNDLAQFIESLPQNDPPDWQRGWFAWDGWSYAYDGEVYDPADYRFGSMYAFNSLELGKGYNYWNVSDHTFTLSGQINTTDPSPSISYSGDETWSGYNLLGNPYSCGINIQTMFNDASWPSTALKSVYYTWGDVAYTVSDGGLSVPGGASLSIPPMQGFFVKATGTGNIPFLESARQHNSTPRYKGELSASIPLVRLSINKNGKSGETVVRFNERATAGLDIDFDAPKFMDSPGLPSIYTSLDGKDFTINGIPFPETSVEIPITVKLLTDGNHVITAMEIQELANYKLSLKDKSTGSTVDLKSFKDYSFSAPAGEIKDRFVLTVTSNLSTTIEDPVSVDNEFNIYSGFDLINIQPLSDQWDGKNGSVRLMDISGKTVRNQPNTEFTKNALIQLPSPGNGIYFIEIRSGIMRYVGKVVVK